MGMGMEYLLGKGHMVFPEDFFMSCIRWKHHTPFCTKRLADKARERERERSEVSSWGTFHVSARRLFSIQ